ncbi:hypothetical protein CSOJ01_04472 [Colletotrichum sojae]|uniref:Uncharacterized protein n=1 Tax=Colletotrichum sojae TaxID=2175907 RepID=A0A8H6JJG9_9PEZI|nr:hypothetical protein CSOJ01_04472 [Colletotrichum sojae]
MGGSMRPTVERFGVPVPDMDEELGAAGRAFGLWGAPITAHRPLPLPDLPGSNDNTQHLRSPRATSSSASVATGGVPRATSGLES